MLRRVGVRDRSNGGRLATARLDAAAAAVVAGLRRLLGVAALVMVVVVLLSGGVSGKDVAVKMAEALLAFKSQNRLALLGLMRE